MKLHHRHNKKKFFSARMLLMSAAAFVALGTQQAQACCSCQLAVQTQLNTTWPQSQQTIEQHVDQEFNQHQQWFVNTLWANNILTAMTGMTNQLSAVAMHQTAIIGTFFDAKQQLETQRSLQKIRAKAHKDYHPSTGMCEFGSTVKSLAASERRSELVAHVMSQRFQDRMLGSTNTAAAGGAGFDKPARLKQFREKFCDPADNDGNLDYLCEHDQDGNLGNSNHRAAAPGGIGAEDTERMNKDIDYTRTVDYPWTLNVDFTDTDLTDHEEEILALADNLYGQEVFKRLSGADLRPPSATAFPAIHQNYLDARAVLAKLSVAKNSFNSIVSMKSAGTSGSRDFMEAILDELGVSSTAGGGAGSVDDMRRLLGYDSNTAGNPEIGPSYHAQMEVLTKKIYQNPDFYTNLYDKPVNIERKQVAMQAIGLMQKFDLFKSYLRNEASLSVLLEMAVVDLQNKVEQEARDQSSVGEE